MPPSELIAIDEYGYRVVRFDDEDLGEPTPFESVEDTDLPAIFTLDGKRLRPYNLLPTRRCALRVRVMLPRARRALCGARRRPGAKRTRSTSRAGPDSEDGEPAGGRRHRRDLSANTLAVAA